MHVKWKKNKNLKPDVILKKINDIKTVSDDGKVSYSGFEYQDAMATLQNMVLFPVATNSLNQESIVSSAVSNIAKIADLSGDKVIAEINSVVKNELATREHKYYVLTSISLRKPYPAKSVSIEGCTIRILDFHYPNKYSGREDLIVKSKKENEGTPRNYAKVIVSAKAKSIKGAATTALRVLDIQRAIWCLFANSSMELFGDEWSPINKIRLGGVHTVHKASGKLASDIFWYEPNFVEVQSFKPQNVKVFTHNAKWALTQLEALPYSAIMKDALLRFVRALDERDQNVALIRLWGALEALTAPAEANYDLVTRRCAYMFKDQDYHRQVLEHLREYRNSSVHAGDQSERAKANCYQLQMYFHQLVLFHLRNLGEFRSLDEANSFLDLPSNTTTLENRKRLIEKAIKFVS